MTHPYPPHQPALPQVGRHPYFLTFCADGRHPAFADAPTVAVVLTQFLRAARAADFVLDAYCFMPDHVHLLAEGTADTADMPYFVTAAKQYSGFHARRLTGRRLWQRYGFERVVRSAEEQGMVRRYIVGNPVRHGLVQRAQDWPHTGSSRWTRDELFALCELS